MRRSIKSKSPIVLILLLLLFATVPHVVGRSVCVAQQANATETSPPGNSNISKISTGGLAEILSTLNLWATFLSILVMVCSLLAMMAIGGVGVATYIQYRQAQKTVDNLVEDTKHRMSELEEKHHLASLKPPDEILKDARNDYDPRIEALRAALEKVYEELMSHISDVKTSAAVSAEQVKELRERFKAIPK